MTDPRGAVSPGRPLVSCVLIFLDGARYIDEAIRSVVGQAGFDEWELILVDDGSTDESTAIATSWARVDPRRITYVDHPGHVNRGMSASRNVGLHVATGAYVAFLDCDDVWLPSALAHRMRVATSHPGADVVVGGTWRWHSWTGDAADLELDVRMALPVAPAYSTLVPPQLLFAIYGIPGGGHVPAMCSLLIRRDALLALGGMESDFRDLYEDQVLYVKLGLKLSAVVDPRPLALYRQHPDSACGVAIANGDWNPWQANDPGERFFAWMRAYVQGEAGERSPEWKLVHRNIAHIRRNADPRALRPRLLFRRFAPRRVRSLVTWLRTRPRGPREEWSPTVAQLWSSQFLEVMTAAMTGEVLVLASGDGTTERWTSEVPADAFGVAARVTSLSLADVPDGARFDHVVVPVRTALTSPVDDLLARLPRLLRQEGSAAVLVPGPAWARPGEHTAPGDARPDHAASARQVVQQARAHFPDRRVSIETFGNPVTARAVATGLAAGAVPGVDIDRHDAETEVLLALQIAPATSPTISVAVGADGSPAATGAP